MQSVNYVNRDNAEMILGTVWAHPKMKNWNWNKIAWTPTAALSLKISKSTLTGFTSLTAANPSFL